MTGGDLESTVGRMDSELDGLKQQLQQALSRISELEQQVSERDERIERLTFRVGKLEECLPDETAEYDTLDRDDKVSLVKSHLLERAYATNGRAGVDYDDIQWSVFDGQPSRDHCYTLMELAAESDGFHVDTSIRPRELRVNLDETTSHADFSRATTNETGGTH